MNSQVIECSLNAVPVVVVEIFRIRWYLHVPEPFVSGEKVDWEEEPVS